MGMSSERFLQSKTTAMRCGWDASLLLMLLFSLCLYVCDVLLRQWGELHGYCSFVLFLHLCYRVCGVAWSRWYVWIYGWISHVNARVSWSSLVSIARLEA